MTKRKDPADKKLGGRPPKFATVEQLEQLCEEYFSDCEINNKPLTISGLVLFLDTNRETLLDYQVKPGFSDVVKKAKLRVEHYVEQKLLTDGGAGSIFWLKNHGWRDKQEMEHAGKVQIVVGSQKDKKALEDI
jgi:hypothetical protein